MTRRQRGFLPALFDLGFSDFVTAKLIRGLYRLIIVTAVNGTVCAWLFAWWLPDWFGWGMKFLIDISAPAAALIWLTISRIVLEHLIVIYAIHEKLTAIEDNTSREGKDNAST